MQAFRITLDMLRRKLPGRAEVLSVFNVLIFVVFGWSIRGFLYEIPSFLLYLNLGDMTAVVFYMMAFAFLECVLLTAGLVLVSLILPSTWLRTGFAYKGFLIILVATTGFILFQGYYKVGFFQNLINNDYSPFRPVLIGTVLGFVLLVGLFWLFHNRPRLQKYLSGFIDQFSVFSYIYVPLGVIGILVVFVRNIF
jgi:hypothetical protein